MHGLNLCLILLVLHSLCVFSLLSRYYEMAKRESQLILDQNPSLEQQQSGTISELAKLYQSMDMDLNQLMMQWKRSPNQPVQQLVAGGHKRAYTDDETKDSNHLKKQKSAGWNASADSASVELQSLISKSLDMFGPDSDDEDEAEDTLGAEKENLPQTDQIQEQNPVIHENNHEMNQDDVTDDDDRHDLPFAEPVSMGVGKPRRAWNDTDSRDYHQEIQTWTLKFLKQRVIRIHQLLNDHLRWANAADSPPAWRLSHFQELSTRAQHSILSQLEMMVNEWAGDKQRSVFPIPRPYLSYRGMRSMAPMVTVSGSRDFFHDVPHQTTGSNNQPIVLMPGDPLHIPTRGVSDQLATKIVHRPTENMLAGEGTVLLGREMKDLSRMALDLRRENGLDNRDPLFIWNSGASIDPEARVRLFVSIVFSCLNCLLFCLRSLWLN